jgi:hypothetical protein
MPKFEGKKKVFSRKTNRGKNENCSDNDRREDKAH